MKAGFGFMALLLALVVVGLLMMKGLNAPTRPSLAAMPGGPVPTAPAASGIATSRALQLQNDAREGVAKAMNDAEARREQAEKP